MPKTKATKSSGASAPQEDINDARFSTFTTDPRFRLPSKKHTRTKVDKRFSSMLKDEDFSNTAKVDRYGRKLSGDGKKKALQRLYQPEEEDEEEEDSEVDIEVEDDDVVERELKRAENYDPARGGGFSSSEDDSDDDDDDDDEDGGANVEGEEQFPDMAEEQNGVPMGEVSRKIAVVNLDWDNIKSDDLFAVFSSFAPPGGRIERVSIYKSEFGKERMEREEMEGPPPEIFARKQEEEDSENDSEDDEDEDDDEVEENIKKDLLKEDKGEEFDSAALRQYQLERLRHYYAVVICSDEVTAQKLYDNTDGTEFLSSANFLDMRFVPDEVDFDEVPRDECTSVPAGYKPMEFVTDALQHSKVKLTWDAEDTGRKDAIKKAFSGSRNDINENDLRAYLGSDSESDAEDEVIVADEAEADMDAPKLTKKEIARQKMRAALGLADEPTKSSKLSKDGPVGDMEITFSAGLTDDSTKKGVFQNAPIVEETTAEAYVRKEKERKARRKARAKAIREGRDPDTETPAKAEPAQDLGFDDPFFAADEQEKTKATKSLRKEERKKKREAKESEAATNASQKAELELLMQDDPEEAENHLDHFDINEIARAEKNKKKRARSKKYAKEPETEGGKRGGLQKNFEMDVEDPRFKAVFESHEFAIDPSNPRFKDTEGMKKLLEEGRKKRKSDDRAGDEIMPAKKSKSAAANPKDDLQSLVASVKRKTR